MQAHIYIVTNQINGKQYVGQSTVERNKLGHGLALLKAYEAHGKKNFSYECICSKINNRNTLNCLEKFWIKVYGTVVPNGYNIEQGGSDKGEVSELTRQKLSAALKGKKPTEETRKRISIATKGENNPFYGKKHSEESLKKIGNASKGRKIVISEETKKYLSSIRKGELNPFYGKKHSEETKAKFVGRKPNKYWSGKKFSQETKEKMSQSQKARPQLKCPHCDKVGGSSGMLVNHFNNCKSIKEVT